jgi:hypothetical protein
LEELRWLETVLRGLLEEYDAGVSLKGIPWRG